MILTEFAVEVRLAQCDKWVQELHEQGSINISLRGTGESDIVLSRVNEAHTIEANHGSLLRGFGGYDWIAEVGYFLTTYKML